MGDGADTDMSRRKFMQVGTTSLLAVAGGTDKLDTQQVAQQISTNANVNEFQGVADLIGPDAAKPTPGSQFFQDKSVYAYRYQATDTGNEYFITQDDGDWTALQMNPLTQVDEVRTENYQSFFNLTFARPGAPDDKNWTYSDADVTKDASEIELSSTTTLESKQRGNYPAGSEAIPGVAWRCTGTPTGGEALAGYFDADNGGLVGEDSTDSFVALRKGGTEKRVYRSDWNGYHPDDRLWVSDQPVITRMPHLFYGGGDFRIRALVHGEESSDLKTLHTFTPDNVSDVFGSGPPFEQPNLPIRFESSSLSGGAIRANAAHYEFGEIEAENRINGEHITGGGSGVSVSDTGWTPLIAWRKRSGWEMVNVKPVKVGISTASNDVKLSLQVNPTLSGATWSLPANTGSDETAVEVSPDATLDSPGERRWVGYASAGQGNKTSSVRQNDVDFNLPATDEIVLAAQGVGGSATVYGVLGWEEFF